MNIEYLHFKQSKTFVPWGNYLGLLQVYEDRMAISGDGILIDNRLVHISTPEAPCTQETSRTQSLTNKSCACRGNPAVLMASQMWNPGNEKPGKSVCV